LTLYMNLLTTENMNELLGSHICFYKLTSFTFFSKKKCATKEDKGESVSTCIVCIPTTQTDIYTSIIELCLSKIKLVIGVEVKQSIRSKFY